uniref:Xrn1 N-terminal domain-containing protein n=1 Tax=viral metagenome TaxID=1070528 RepID=A0A6C0DAR3_9ZZZZ
MGIPSYFSYIIKNYPNIIRNLNYFKDKTIQDLYMDCNSIIYDSVYSIDKQIFDELTIVDLENHIINQVINNIKIYIDIIRPTNTIFIAFDGVAPFAKMDQQRTRRYKSIFISNNSFVNKNSKWNTSAITPGTEFMEKLSKMIDYEFKFTEKKYNCNSVIVSCSNEVGEGEHKLFNHLRKNKFENDNVAVYGLDADLIMLSIFNLKFSKNIYVFREAPEFLKSSIPIDIIGKDTEPYFLDIQHLSSCILNEMLCKYSDYRRIHDYVFLCFFLGNDFLPHFPAMNIRTHGIQGLLDIYRNCIGNYPERFLINNNKIQWRNVSTFINEVAKCEHELLLNEYFVRDKFDKRHLLETTPQEKDDIINSVPIIYRQKEKYICPQEPEWEKRYYKSLFHFEKNNENIKNICNNYLEGLEWVYKYYSFDCPDWRWKYNYHYPPLFSDLSKYIPHFEMDFIVSDKKTNNPFSKMAQLSYVMPSSNLELLPNNICVFLKNNYPELYPEKYHFEWAFCRYFWEAHPLLPVIPISLLEQWEIQFDLSIKK